MKNVGWEIRPIGWLVIISLIAIVVYLFIKKWHDSDLNQSKGNLGK